MKGHISTNRQDLPKCYFLSHNIWVLNTKKMLESHYEGQQPWGFMGNNIAYYEIDESIDIHKEIDLKKKIYLYQVYHYILNYN